MTTDLAVYDGPVSMPSKIEYARTLAASGLLPPEYRAKPENLLWAIEFAQMLDLSPMAAITSVHVISGKPAASAQLIGALVRRAGHRLRVRGSATDATAQVIRHDDPDYVFEVTWTLERARTAQLLKNDNWTKYPSSMLTARAVTEVARLACPEALLGMGHTPEELGAVVDEDGAVLSTAERRPAARPRSITEAAAAVVPTPPPAPRAEPDPIDVAPEPESEPTADALSAAEPEPALNQGQVRKMHALFRAAELEDRDGRLVVTARIVGRPLASSNDLTRAEGAQVIDVLEDLQNDGVLVETVAAMRGDGELPPEPTTQS